MLIAKKRYWNGTSSSNLASHLLPLQSASVDPARPEQLTQLIMVSMKGSQMDLVFID
jgi:hypothetical protein